ncbi:MAG: hypothetical protein AB1490_26155 [Pseudomonadota bacterium]
MQRIATILAGAVMGFAAFSVTPASAVDTQTSVRTNATDISAQSRKRPRTTLTIRPRGYPYRNFPTTYPLPYAVEYPGPSAVRQCAARYVEEYRPSGTVIVPRMRCWWERG